MRCEKRELVLISWWVLVGSLLTGGVATGQSRELREERLEAYASVVLDWHVRAADLSTETAGTLQTVLDRSVASSTRSYDPARFDAELVLFAGRVAGPARAMFDGVPWRRQRPTAWRKALNAELTESQRNAIQRKIAARNLILRRLAAEGAAGVLTSFDVVDTKLRDALTAALIRERGDEMLNHPFTKQSLPVFNLNTAKEVKEHLTPAGRLVVYYAAESTRSERLGRLTAELPFDPLPDSKREPNYDRFLESIESEADRVLGAYQKALVAAYQLSDKQAARLRLAVKGVLVRKRALWRETAAYKLKMFERMNGRQPIRKMTVTVPIPVLNHEPLWIRARDKVLGKQSVGGANGRSLRQARTSHVMFVLDQELWLTDAQRKSVRKLVAKSLSQIGSDTDRPLNRTVYDVLRRVSKDDLEQILTANQQVAWNTMKKLSVVTPGFR